MRDIFRVEQDQAELEADANELPAEGKGGFLEQKQGPAGGKWG